MSESSGVYAYLGVFVALVAAGLGFPIPEEIPVVTGGGLCAHAANIDPPRPHDWSVGLMGLPDPATVAVRAPSLRPTTPPKRPSRSRAATRSGGSCCRCASSASSLRWVPVRPRPTRRHSLARHRLGPAAPRQAGEAGQDRRELPQVRRQDPPRRPPAARHPGADLRHGRRHAAAAARSSCSPTASTPSPASALLFGLAYWFTDQFV